MALKPLPPHGDLRQLLRYEPDTGRLFWKERGPEWFDGSAFACDMMAARWNGQFCGREAFTSTTKQGYKQGTLLGIKYLAHRLVYAIFHGTTDFEFLDHINRDKTDNRICNLREASSYQNMCNLPSRGGTSRYRGVSWRAKDKVWIAKAQFKGAVLRSSPLKCEIEAAKKYNEMALSLQGEFAILNPV